MLTLDLLVHHQAFNFTLFDLILNDVFDTERLIEWHSLLVEHDVLPVAVSLLFGTALVAVLRGLDML